MPSYIRTRSEFAVNSFTAGNQTAPSVSTFADGGFVVAWGTGDPSQDGDQSAIKAQLFDSAGSKVGTEFLVNVAAPGAQFTASVATLANGNFVVTWVTNVSDDDSDGIKARLFDRSGDPISGEFRVNSSTAGSHFTANVAALSDGGFVISWDDWNGFDVKAQRFDSAGGWVGSEFRLNTNTAAFQEFGDIVGLAGGGFVATWRTTDTSADGSGEAVKAQVFDGSGAKVGAEFLVNSHKVGSQYSPTIAALSGGGFIIAWYTSDSAQDGSAGAIKAQVFSASGSRVGAEFLVNSQTANIQQEPVVTARPDGGFVIAWVNQDPAQDGSGSAIKAQAFDAAGARIDGEILVNTLSGGAQFLPEVATLADGRIVVAWASESGDSGGYAVRAQILGTEPAEPLPNTSPIIISNGGGTSVSLIQDEWVTAVTTVVASDDGEPNALRYSIAGGHDAALFTIDKLTGSLSFISPPDHVEGADNFYSVTVSASDGELSGFQSIQISVRHVNRVVIVSDGGYDWAEISVAENKTAVTAVTAVDDDGAPLVYSISGGVDSSFFTIDASTGVLSFATAPDYETPRNWYGDNIYYVDVTAGDGTVSDTQQLAVRVEDVEESGGLAIVSNGGGDRALVETFENETAVTTVAASGSGPVVYEIVGGDDARYFEIDRYTGELRFRYAPDFEGPYDYRYDDVYEVAVRAGDGRSFDQQLLTVVLKDVDEAPEIYSYYGAEAVALSMSENGFQVGQVAAWDPDVDHEVPTYSIVGGADAALFVVDRYSGYLGFRRRPDFERPEDADGDNVYDVVVAAHTGALGDTQAFAVRIVNENEGIRITSNGGSFSASISVAENGRAVTTVVAHDPDGTVPTYSISGGADSARFTIDSRTGALSFVKAPDREAPEDDGRNNVYDVTVAASDGQHTSRQDLAVTVSNVNEGVAITSASAVSTAENGTAITTVTASDIDGDTVRYSIAGGADAALFVIDTQTGALSFAAPANFEAPGDSDGDNVYEVVVAASDGSLSDSRAFSVSVSNADEGPAVHSYGGASSVSLAVQENGRTAAAVSAADPDGDPVSYRIAGGADALLFAVDAATGALSFVSAPDFEAPADSDRDGRYEVEVAASSTSFSAAQSFVLTVGNVDEAAAITSNGGGSSASVRVSENVRSVTTVAARDPDGGAVSYSIAGGADASHFTIDPQTGALQFVAAPDYETPGDADGDNRYEVVVQASDGALADLQTLSVTIANVRDGRTITGTAGQDTVGATATSEALRTTNAEDTVYGRDGHDTIDGEGGSDDLYGDGGKDVLTGGAGGDRLTGGAAADQFFYNSVSDSAPAAPDMIVDFSRAQGDRISLSAIDSNSAVAGNQAFTFIGSAAFSKTAGQLRYETAGGNTIVSGDVDGDGAADIQILLAGSLVLAGSDFIL